MSGVFRKIGLVGQPANRWAPGTLDSLAAVLARHAASVLASEHIASGLEIAQTADNQSLIAASDLVIVAGGDGTLLSWAWPLAKAQVPVTGINFGRLGFLADIAPERIEQELPVILAGQGALDKRLLLAARTEGAGDEEEPFRALNEVLIHAPEVSRLVEFEVQVDDRLLYRIRADGIIVATPTGSTAYALSAGGSILAPGLQGLAVVPMLAHGPGSGSVVLPADSSICITSSSETRLTADGTARCQLAANQSVLVTCEEKMLSLLHPVGHSFFARVRGKLGWGLSSTGDNGKTGNQGD